MTELKKRFEEQSLVNVVTYIASDNVILQPNKSPAVIKALLKTTHPVWPGNGVVYFQRLGVERTRSRLSKITLSPLYKSLTIRSWNATTKLLKLLEEVDKW